MGKKIAWTDPAKADLRAIDQATAIRILHVVARYLATGEGDVQRLQNVEPPEVPPSLRRLSRPLSRSRRFHPRRRGKTSPRSLPLNASRNTGQTPDVRRTNTGCGAFFAVGLRCAGGGKGWCLSSSCLRAAPGSHFFLTFFDGWKQTERRGSRVKGARLLRVHRSEADP
jgi:hypothetical protein